MNDSNLNTATLTHWGWNKMAAISQTTFSNAFSWNENVWIAINISPKFVHKGQINNIPALVQIMAWRRSGDKPLSEPMMAYLNDVYMRHSASMSLHTFQTHFVKWKMFIFWLKCHWSLFLSSFSGTYISIGSGNGLFLFGEIKMGLVVLVVTLARDWDTISLNPILNLSYFNGCDKELTHKGWVTDICVSKLDHYGSDNGLSLVRCQAIIWTNANLHHYLHPW